ncbi:N-acetylglucosaminyltransferase [Phenylobacterium soli]|uniref:N-acetylglucosaminyltransferase n=2 Tax=Phenylobacterium soli TaxID=2170551 RepID=A0A328APH3_9CAUL|nr:N-acetylglucosaminyltransferase [Phenylobacterium soli]
MGLAAWFLGLYWFWVWWFEPGHYTTPVRWLATTAVLIWLTWVPGYFIVIFNNARVLKGLKGPPPGARVAIVVAKAPSEPFALAKKTLMAALVQERVTHDTWLADEDPDPETLAWCAAHGVKVSTRKGVADYHRAEWPRRTACKEGNLAYFYDHYGYDRYDFVSQFDVDHVPGRFYLWHALAPFNDPRVGYVSAPSICDGNAGESWAARGRLYIEASMHGALQTGYNDGWAPLCIGSHYTVRTAALKGAGGLGPELAEDHSTTLILNAAGWRGVHAVDAIAHGQGPETFTDLVTQEFQWSRSLVTILIRHTPRYLSKLPLKLKFQFLFSELWYPTYSAMMAIAFASPIVALLTRARFVNVTYADYLLHVAPMSIMLIAMAYWWRSTGLYRPANAKILSWEGVAFVFLRWPWSLIGSATAVFDCVGGRKVDFRVTPKAMLHTDPVPFRVLAPYVVIALASAAAAWLVKEPGSAGGFYVFALVDALFNLVLILTVLVRHARENRGPVFGRSLAGALNAGAVAAIALLIGLGAYENGPRGIAAMNAGFTVFTLAEPSSPPAGAGRSRAVTWRIRPRWHGFAAQTQPEAGSEGPQSRRRGP